MRDFKFDMDIILRNAERFGVKIDKSGQSHGVTMNGNQFNVTDEMAAAFTELARVETKATRTDVSVHNSNHEGGIVKVSIGVSGRILPEQNLFSDRSAPLNAA